MEKDIKVQYIIEPAEVLPVYDVEINKSWIFTGDNWKFVKGVRGILLTKHRIENKKDIIKIIRESTSYLPNCDGYIIAFIYCQWREEVQPISLGLLFIEDKIISQDWCNGFERSKDFDSLPDKIKRQSPIVYTKEQFYKIKTERLFKKIYNFETNGIMAEFECDGPLYPDMFLYLEKHYITAKGDKFHIGYEIKDLKSYNSRSQKL